MSLSKIVLSGRVVRAPEKRFTPNNNVAVTEFAIAVTSPPRADGQVETSTVRVVTWRDLAERCASEIKKGDLVAVDGRLQINTHTSPDGQRKRDAEVDAIYVENLSTQLGAAPAQVELEGQTARAAQSREKTQNQSFGRSGNDLDAMFASEDEIPF